MSDYLPIDCGLHSQYELLAMHQQKVILYYFDEQGVSRQLKGRVKDVLTRDEAEYLSLRLHGGGDRLIRLDRIQRFAKELG
ncbi:MAG TPA: transcriptional antiterminator, Rof [Thiolapillus brandeum]|uniref:Transcriptional antiterminator, Rof n=1 Tax=Thiolapillus brandeum TaxID=1076588 RepID=A0A831KCL6_9GAMM|nr:transcriptional antiterminator, Rof [Thiolapillus brandeum]